MESIKFSIILPTFNRANFITKAIESVINQTYKNWELIVIDDGSTDNTEEIIQKFIKKEKRITYYYQKNQERSAARNYGISKANGEFICFLDSDDLYHYNHIECFVDLINEKEKKKGLYFSGVSFGKYENSNQYYDIKVKNNLEFVILNSIGVPRACCHKEILIKNKFDISINMGEDKELWSRIVLNYPMYYHKKKTFIEIEHLGRSINNSTSTKVLEITKKILRKNKISFTIKRRIFSEIYFRISKEKYTEKKRLIFVIYLLQSLVLNPYSHQTKFKINILWNMFIINTDKLEKLIKNEE